MDYCRAKAKADLYLAQQLVELLISSFQDAANKLNNWQSAGVVFSGHVSTAPIVIYASQVPTPEQIGVAIEEWRHAQAAVDTIERQFNSRQTTTVE